MKQIGQTLRLAQFCAVENQPRINFLKVKSTSQINCGNIGISLLSAYLGIDLPRISIDIQICCFTYGENQTFRIVHGAVIINLEDELQNEMKIEKG